MKYRRIRFFSSNRPFPVAVRVFSLGLPVVSLLSSHVTARVQHQTLVNMFYQWNITPIQNRNNDRLCWALELLFQLTPKFRNRVSREVTPWVIIILVFFMLLRNDVQLQCHFDMLSWCRYVFLSRCHILTMACCHGAVLSNDTVPCCLMIRCRVVKLSRWYS